MAVLLEIRNPTDLTATYDKIEIQRSTTNTVAGMADITTTLAIDTTTASDLSTGYTAYTDSGGTAGTHYYRYRYKVTSSGAVSSYSDIFLSGTTVLHSRFRRMMRDTNSNNYFFTNDDIDFFLAHAVDRLWPITWFETYSDTMVVPDGTTEIFTFTVGVTRLNDLDFVDSSGNNLGKISNWKIRGRQVFFETAIRSGNTVRSYTEKRFLKLSEIPELWDGHLLNIMRLQAFETLEADRARYYKYTTVAQPEGGNLPSIDRVITRLEAQIEKRENQLRRVRKPASINLA